MQEFNHRRSVLCYAERCESGFQSRHKKVQDTGDNSCDTEESANEVDGRVGAVAAPSAMAYLAKRRISDSGANEEQDEGVPPFAVFSKSRHTDSIVIDSNRGRKCLGANRN